MAHYAQQVNLGGAPCFTTAPQLALSIEGSTLLSLASYPFYSLRPYFVASRFTPFFSRISFRFTFFTALTGGGRHTSALYSKVPKDVLLSVVYRATTQNRISPRKDAVLGDLGQMLLRARREIVYRRSLEPQPPSMAGYAPFPP
jgi:hypothetical protein